jgi:hypothetical protein
MVSSWRLSFSRQKKICSSLSRLEWRVATFYDLPGIPTHQAEKLEALRNAVLNIAASKRPAGDLQVIFLHLVDGFTPTHLQVLSHFAGKDRSWADRFRRERDLTDQVVCDLRDRGMLRDTRPYAARGRDDAEALVYYDWEVTNLGRQFLEFIQSPMDGKL